MHYKFEALEFKEWKKLNPHESVFVVPEVKIAIDNWAFADSPQLKKIVLPSKLVELGYKAFENSNNIEEICFSGGEQKSQGGRYVITNGYLYDAFNKAIIKVFSNSEVIEIPEGVKYLDRLCFAGRKNLKKVIIPASVLSMEVPFTDCNSLKEIIVSKDNEVYEVKENCLYEKKRGILERVITADKDFAVPDFINEIRAGVFPFCVEKVDIPVSVKKVNASAGENSVLKTQISEWRKKSHEIKNEVYHVVNFDFSLSNFRGQGLATLKVSTKLTSVFDKTIVLEEKSILKIKDALENIISTRQNYSLIYFNTPQNKDIICVAENYGDKFMSMKCKLKDGDNENLLMITFLIPEADDKYAEFSRFTRKTDFVSNLYKVYADVISDAESTLIESILEMDDIEAYYDRVE